MSTSSVLRIQIESLLAKRIPSALTPARKSVRPVAPIGIASLDELLASGLPLGAITEIVGGECSGHSSFALSFIAQLMKGENVCAWIDVSDTLHPESAVAAGVQLNRLLWVRCGVQAASKVEECPQGGFELPEKYLIPKPTKIGLHGGGFGPHPRGEVKGLSNAVSGLLRPKTIAPRCAEPQPRIKTEKKVFEPIPLQPIQNPQRQIFSSKPWTRIEQALQVTDLLLQAGGFSAVVLDMGSIAPEYASRVPLATWFRYRAAAERTQTSILLLTQHACAKSSAELVLRLQAHDALYTETTVFSGVLHYAEVSRQRSVQNSSNVVPLRKAPQRCTTASWRTQTTWTGRR
jgi:recombination protein RecA